MSTDGNNSRQEDLDELNEQGNRIQELMKRIEDLPDPRAGELMQECLRAVLGLHGAGLKRILQIVSIHPALHQELINDGLLRGLLLVHGLHPDDLRTRLEEALDKLLPYIHSHGGNLELVSLEDGIAILRFQGACKTCPSSALTAELAIKRAVAEACPDLLSLEIEGMDLATLPAGTK